jgi:hypothetical protein
MTPQPWPEVADHETALIAAEALWGAPIPDIAEEADMTAWRSAYADLLAKGPEAVMQDAAASNAEFDRQADAERRAERELEAGQ